MSRSRGGLARLWPWLLVIALGAAALLTLRQQPATAPDPAAQRHDDSNASPLPPLRPPPPPEAAVGEPPRPPAPAKPGSTVEVVLAEPPATFYARGEAGDSDLHYRAVLRKVGGADAVHSPELGRAAREMVFQFTELGREPTSDIREFLIRGAGALAADSTFQHATTNSEAGEVLERAIAAAVREPLDGDGPLVVGIGEVFVAGTPPRRHVGVVATRLPIALEPTPRTVRTGGAWLLRGRLLAPFRDIEALAMGPDGAVRRGTVRVEAGVVSAVVDAGPTPGPLDVQLVGKGPRGPGKLVQLQAEVSADGGVDTIPDRATFRLPADESGLRDARDAAALAWQLLNDDRRAAGLPALQWDQRLADVAEGHSRDMRDAGFFSHHSATTGMHGDRLARAGYRAVRSAENLAHNLTLAEAERGLLHSLGHRRNLLSREFSHGGVGVVGEVREGGGRRWWLTQLFATPVRIVDARAEADSIAAAVAAARADKGLARLQRHAGLDALAASFALRARQGALDGVGDAVLDAARARGLLGRRLRAWTAQTHDAAALDLPASALDGGATRLGVGVDQDAAGDGRIGVVVLVGE